MARDYAARNRRPAAKPAGLPGWVWLVAGLSMGLVVAVIVYIARPAQPMPMAPAGGAVAKPRARVEIPPKEEPRFDFYTLLAKEQVVVAGQAKPPRSPVAVPTPPDNTPAAATPPVQGPAAPPSAASASAPGSDRYLVLAGSFRDQANAEQHRASLAMAGIEARVEAVKGQDSGTWHRVRIGPQNSLSAAEAALAQLKAGGFEGRVLRQP